MEYEKRKCEECDKEFIPKGKNQYGIQKFCSKECKKKNDNKTYYYKKKSKATLKGNKATLKNNIPAKKIPLKKEIENTKQFQYNTSNGIKTIIKFESIAKEVYENMQILDLDVYSNNKKSVCLDIMRDIRDFLNNQLKIYKDRRVINV